MNSKYMSIFIVTLMVAYKKPKIVVWLIVLWCCVWLYCHEIHVD